MPDDNVTPFKGIDGTGDEVEASLDELTRLLKLIAIRQKELIDVHESHGLERKHAVRLVERFPEWILRDLHRG